MRGTVELYMLWEWDNYQLIAEAPRFLRFPWMLQGNVSVNVATFWGFTTSNYEMLSRLQKTYADQPVLLLHAFFSKSPLSPGPVRNGEGLAVTDVFLENTMPKNVGLLPINSGSVAKDQWPTILRLKKQLMFKTACIWIMLVHVASFSAGYGYFLFLFNPRNPLLLFVPLHQGSFPILRGFFFIAYGFNQLHHNVIPLLWFSSAITPW